VIFLALLLGGPVAEAAEFGVQGSYGHKTRLGLGARAIWRPGAGFGLTTSLDYFPYPEDDAIRDGWGMDASYFEANGNLTYAFAHKRQTPYLGVGLNVAHVSVGPNSFSRSATSAGLNLLGGLRFHRVFLEARVSPTNSPRIRNAHSLDGVFSTRIVPRKQVCVAIGLVF